MPIVFRTADEYAYDNIDYSVAPVTPEEKGYGVLRLHDAYDQARFNMHTLQAMHPGKQFQIIMFIDQTFQCCEVGSYIDCIRALETVHGWQTYLQIQDGDSEEHLTGCLSVEMVRPGWYIDENTPPQLGSPPHFNAIL